ncbi:hypothetical protein [Nonomuraea sp. GTA35]|uniref:hypothetical protein n=1 Tax=Nonomuraea sp. GTA35 TaxID=1676746 RepID=UPI0035BFDC12
MNTTLLLLLLAFPACVIREPTEQARTFGEMVARVCACSWWEIPLWPVLALAVPFALALWWAARSVLFNVSRLAAWLLAKTATATATDGRRYRLVRTERMVALQS